MGRGGVEKLGGGECSVNGEMGKDLCPNFFQPLLESIDRRSRELIPAFHNPHRKFRTSASEVARTLEYLEGVPP